MVGAPGFYVAQGFVFAYEVVGAGEDFLIVVWEGLL